MQSSKPLFMPGMIAAGSLIGIGVIAALSTLAIRITTHQEIGPATAPLAVSLALVLVGLALGGQAISGNWSCEASRPDEARPRMAAVGWLAAGMTSSLVLIEPIGFMPAAGLLFTCIAQALGSRSLARGFVMGLLLAGGLELLFTRLLGVELGSGVLSLSGW